MNDTNYKFIFLCVGLCYVLCTTGTLLFEILDTVGLRPIESSLNKLYIDPSNRQMLTQCLFNVGPASQRVAQYWVHVSCCLLAYHAM